MDLAAGADQYEHGVPRLRLAENVRTAVNPLGGPLDGLGQDGEGLAGEDQARSGPS